MSKNSKQIAILSVFAAFFVLMILYANKGCDSMDCWGSSAQKRRYVEDPKLILKIKKLNKRWAFSDSFARAKVFDRNFKNFWFADWWNKDHWEYSIFPVYSSKEECYKKAYSQAIQRYTKKIKAESVPFSKALKLVEAKAPVRCFPGGTPVANRWDYRR